MRARRDLKPSGAHLIFSPSSTGAGAVRSWLDAVVRHGHAGRRKQMEIKRCGSQPSGKGPADYFTGTVRIDPLFDTRHPQRASGGSVTFEPGGRTALHIHP